MVITTDEKDVWVAGMQECIEDLSGTDIHFAYGLGIGRAIVAYDESCISDCGKLHKLLKEKHIGARSIFEW